MKYNIFNRKIFAAFSAAIITFYSSVHFLPCKNSNVFAKENNLYVGYSNISESYSTVQSAVDAAERINPSSESERIIIHIAPGTYREQINVNTPYISFVNDTPSQEVLLTWYYGIGYKYYRVGSSGNYNASAATSKSSKTEPIKRWGYAVGLSNKANNFRAENITFENSFNRYVTDEEIADGVEIAGSQSITFERKKGSDVKSKAATERAAAISIESANCEFYDCEFLGSQDTLYTGGSQGYFKNCFIQGNTDYIFGTGKYIFDNCELNFGGYSSNSVGGYITANRGNGGYLFYNCEITANSTLTVNPGYFGRPWGDADVAFVNTKLQSEDIIKPVGWCSMSGREPEDADYKEYNTTVNGNPVNTSARTANTVKYSENGLTPKDYFGSWVPFYYNYTPSDKPNEEYNKSYILDAGNIETGTYSSPIEINDVFTITASEEKTVSITAENIVSDDNKHNLNGLIRLGGGGSPKYRSIQINAPKKGRLNIYMMSSNTENPRTVNLLDAYENVISSIENVTGSSLKKYEFSISSSGTYYITSSSSGLNVGCIDFQTDSTQITGDINSDDVIDCFDLTALRYRSVNTHVQSKNNEISADLNNDGFTDSSDLIIMQDYIIRKID